MIIYIKSKEEIDAFRFVGKETARIINILIQHIKIGNTGNNIDELAREECKKINAQPAFLNYNGFPAAICFSKNNTMVHGIPDDSYIEPNDIISIDFGLEIDGFIGDVAKTIVAGDDIKNNQLKHACDKALSAAIEKVAPNNKLCEIGKTIYKIAKENKFLVPESYGGHGIDRFNMHMPPFIPNYYYEPASVTLRPGMILAIEPMFINSSSNVVQVAKDKWSVIANGNTAHTEHTVLVTNEGCDILTY
jgi:methionyl aminopeptidase